MPFSVNRERLIIYSIIAVLAIILIGLLVYQQVGVKDRKQFRSKSEALVSGMTSSEASKPFDVSVLQSPEYLSLDRSLFDAGILPVPPPESRGKPNIFGP